MNHELKLLRNAVEWIELLHTHYCLENRSNKDSDNSYPYFLNVWCSSNFNFILINFTFFLKILYSIH